MCLSLQTVYFNLRCDKTSLQVRYCECGANQHLGVDLLKVSMCLVGWLGTVQYGLNPTQTAVMDSREKSWLAKT